VLRGIPFFAAPSAYAGITAAFSSPASTCNRSRTDAVIVDSYVPDGIASLDLVNEITGGVRAFYDIDTPVTVAALEQDRCAYLAARQLRRWISISPSLADHC
jgi:hypothetical protein